MEMENLEEIRRQERQDQAQYDEQIDVCLGTACLSSGSLDVFQELQKMAQETRQSCRVKCVGCRGLCARGPLLSKRCGAETSRATYCAVTAAQSEEILNSCHRPTSSATVLTASSPFFELQQKIVLENVGVVDPESIRDYISRDGYFTLERVLRDFTPSQVIEEIEASGDRKSVV